MAGPTPISRTDTQISTDTTAHTIDLPSVSAGDGLLVVGSLDGGTTVTDWDGFTELDVTSNGTVVTLAIGYLKATGSEGSTKDLVVSASQKGSWKVYKFATADVDFVSDSPEVGTAVTGDSTSPDPPNLAPSWGSANNWWLAVEGHDSNNVSTGFPSSYTNTESIAADPGSGSTVLSTAERELVASSENPGAFTMPTEQWVANTVVVTESCSSGVIIKIESETLQLPETNIKVLGLPGDPLENDLHHLVVYGDTSPSFTPSSANRLGEIPASKSQIELGIPVIATFPMEDTATRYIKVTAVNNAGSESSPSSEATVTALLIDTQHITDLAVTEAKIGSLAVTTAKVDDAAITTAKIGNLEVTDAKIDTLTAAKITAGTINSETIILGTSGGDGIIESDNFVTGPGGSGFQIRGDGVAELNEVTVRGGIFATSGEISGDLEIVSGGKIISRSGTDDSGLTIYPSGLIEFQPGDITAPSLSAFPFIDLGGADDSVRIESALPSGGSVSRISVGTNNAPGFSGLLSIVSLGVGAEIIVSSANRISFSAKTIGGTANTAPYTFVITNNPSSADLFQLTLGVTNRFKVRNDGRIMTSAAYIYFNNSTGDWLNINTAGNLSISGNVMYFGNTSEYIQLSDASNWFRIVQDGV